MVKYSFEFKKKVVFAYLNGEGGYPSLIAFVLIIILRVG